MLPRCAMMVNTIANCSTRDRNLISSNELPGSGVPSRSSSCRLSIYFSTFSCSRNHSEPMLSSTSRFLLPTSSPEIASSSACFHSFDLNCCIHAMNCGLFLCSSVSGSPLLYICLSPLALTSNTSLSLNPRTSTNSLGVAVAVVSSSPLPLSFLPAPRTFSYRNSSKCSSGRSKPNSYGSSSFSSL